MDERIDDFLNDLFDIYAQPGTFGLEMDRNDFLAACEDRAGSHCRIGTRLLRCGSDSSPFAACRARRANSSHVARGWGN